MGRKKDSIGFGFIPEESQHHFLVLIPRNADGRVYIYERFQWNPEQDLQSIDERSDKPKVALSKHKWKQLEETLRVEFNKRLAGSQIKFGKWNIGQVAVERLLGKEMVLLAWAIEDCDPSVIPIAIKNWQGLSPEERWWLFTMTNASTGGLEDRRGWRKAVRFALTENPIEESNRQRNLLELFLEKDLQAGSDTER